VARALLDEARDAAEQATKLELSIRAAEVLAGVDADRALSLVGDVLKTVPSHAKARKLEGRLHETAGRWELAGRAIAARIGHAKDDSEKLTLWLALAEMQKTRLNLPREALASLKAARKLDPKHPVPPEAIARVLESLADHEGLRAALEELATDATTPEDRARHLVRAAEIDELRLSDDAGAASLYGRALAQTPDDELIVERLVRVLARIAPAMALGTLLPAGVDAPATKLGRAGAFERAMLLLGAGTDVAQATALVESVLAQEPSHVPAMRTLEGIARATRSLPLLANTLSHEAAAFRSPIAKLGALWGVAALVEWQLPESTETAFYQQILELAPGDRAALDGSLRRALVHTRMADSSGRAVAVSALRGLLRHASDDTGILAIHLQLGTLIERAGDPTDPGASDAIEHYRAALRIDPLSVTAAMGAARLATQLRDAEVGLAAAAALADLATEPKVRARHLLEAADLLLAAQDPRLGEARERRPRAAEMLEQALEADPESIPAAGRLGTLRAEDHQNDRLVAALLSAIRRAQAPDAIVMLGGEIARIARDELHDLAIAIDAMQRVREVAPRHVPSLLTLAELYIAHRGWREAIEVLETVVSTSRETPEKLTALFGLASLYERVVAQPADVERVLRAALDLEPTGSRALRALLRHLRTTAASTPAGREQIAGLLERLVEAEPKAEEKQAILLEVFELRTSMQDRSGAERALIEAAAQAPSADVLARLTAFHQGDQAAHARALAAVVSRGQKIGRVDAGWLAALGELEVGSMGRSQEGIAHLRQAVQLDPTLFESRFHLARALAQIGGNEEAAGTLLPMLTPDPHPFLALKDQGAGLDLLERALSSSRRGEEAIAVRELRSIAGCLDDGGHAWLRSRRLSYDPPSVEGLDRATLVKRALPPEGRHVLLEVAAAASGMEGKIFRANLAELGISGRERIGPRSGHPFRAQLDRVTRILALEEVELAISDAVSFARVFIQDVPWLVVPPALADQPEPLQLAAIARALTRVALRVPWIEDLPPPHVHAYLIAVARQVVPDFASGAEDRYVAELVASYQPRVAHAIGRKQRKLLADLSPQLEGSRTTAPEVDALVHAVARAEYRVAFLASGELLSTFDELRALDAAFARTSSTGDTRALAAVLTHPLAGDVVRFAMSPEATALRWRIGTVWGAAKS
jgi:tetratricopeptide (TPR) repeat protein